MLEPTSEVMRPATPRSLSPCCRSGPVLQGRGFWGVGREPHVFSTFFIATVLLCQQGASAHLAQLVISVTSVEGASATFSLYVSVAAAAVVLVATPSALQVGPNVSWLF
jgi:hypothetical protein